jgi:bifunctional non-homologous end joining protein LigD
VRDLASLRPMLATPGSLPPDGSGFAYEFKWDGMRVLAAVEKGKVSAVSRNGNDAAARFPELQALAEALGRKSSVLDGELVVLDREGKPDFGLMQHRMALSNARDIAAATATHPVQFLAFDLLELGGRNLMRSPYTLRRERLEGLGLSGTRLAVPPYQKDDGEAVLVASRQLGLEGVVAKRLTSPYVPGDRSSHWVKVRNRNRQEFVVGGWTKGEGSRSTTVGSLLLGVYGSPLDAGAPASRKLHYVGRVGSGFRDSDLAFLNDQLKSLASAASPFHPFDPEGAKPLFVKPRLVCEAEFSGLANHKVLRQAAFKGFRTDKPAKDVVWEQPDVRPW